MTWQYPQHFMIEPEVNKTNISWGQLHDYYCDCDECKHPAYCCCYTCLQQPSLEELIETNDNITTTDSDQYLDEKSDTEEYNNRDMD